LPESVGNAIVGSDDFENGLWYTALPPEVDDLYQSAWDEFRASGLPGARTALTKCT
jgi:hypothetical protein